MFDPLDVPGYDVLAPLGAGRSWKALAAPDRARVVLRPVHGGDETLRRLRREAALWGSVASEHLVAVRDVFSVDPYVHVVVSDYAPGGGLDALLARRGELDDGEIVTLVLPLADALAAAHVRGLAHRRISVGNVVFGHDGRPMLTDATLSTGDDDGAAQDVAALVGVATACLGDRRRGPVYDALVGATSAADLAAAVRAAAPARVIALHDAGGLGGHSDVRSVRSRGHRPLVVVAAAIVFALVVGIAWGHKDDAVATSIPQPTPSPTAASPAPSASAVPPTSQPWLAVVQRLEDQRVRTFRMKLRRDRLRPLGLDIRLDSVKLLTASEDRAVVRVFDGWTSYEVVDGLGNVVSHRPARLHHATTLVLRRTPDGWRIQRVVH